MLEAYRETIIGACRRCLLTVAVGAFAAAAAAQPDLSGTWVLDEDRSDDPGTTVEKADSGGVIGRMRRSTSGSAVIFGIPVPVPERDTSDRDRARSHNSPSLVRSGHVLSVIDRLSINQDDEAAELVYDTLKAATYEYGVPLDTGYSTIVASWSGDRLVVVHELLGGTEITETYELANRGTELHWDVRVKSEGIRTIRVARVYERAGANGLQLTADL